MLILKFESLIESIYRPLAEWLCIWLLTRLTRVRFSQGLPSYPGSLTERLCTGLLIRVMSVRPRQDPQDNAQWRNGKRIRLLIGHRNDIVSSSLTWAALSGSISRMFLLSSLGPKPLQEVTSPAESSLTREVDPGSSPGFWSIFLLYCSYADVAQFGRATVS